MKNYYFTSESVTEGHPDKLCDAISDTILDAYLQLDKDAKVAVETFAMAQKIVIAGQITSHASVDIEPLVRQTIQDIGYDNAQTDIDYRMCEIEIRITKQSPDIALGVDIGGAGDQGMVFGYACIETKEYMPYAIMTAHALAKQLTYVRKQGILPYLRPDGKTQVTVEYEGDMPKRIDTILISTQHTEGIAQETIQQDIWQQVIQPVIEPSMLDVNTKILVNPTGRFVIGGPLGDTGLTGRKIMVDTYGGYAHHGGGAFSGKDATKVDRSAAYMARHIAKNVVANGYATKCEIQIAYAIGKKDPISILVQTFGTHTIPEETILQKIQHTFDMTPQGIIQYLELKKPIYTKTTNYGHFGKLEMPWEKIIVM